ncbi:MAG: histidine kinase [Fibrobacteria bacterium]|nr:histidine kinase [Fibrobacteria bacterium]
MTNKKIQSLEKEIQDLQARWPVHSVPASMLEELEDLEDELEREKKKIAILP